MALVNIEQGAFLVQHFSRHRFGSLGDELLEERKIYYGESRGFPVVAVKVYALIAIVIFGALANLGVLRKSWCWSIRNFTGICFANLSLSQLGMIVCCLLPKLVTVTYGGWAFGDRLCWLYNFVEGFYIQFSILILGLATLERYLTIVKRLNCPRLFTRLTLRLVLITTWSIPALISIPQSILASTYPDPELQGKFICGLVPRSNDCVFCMIIQDSFPLILHVASWLLVSRIAWKVWSEEEPPEQRDAIELDVIWRPPGEAHSPPVPPDSGLDATSGIPVVTAPSQQSVDKVLTGSTTTTPAGTNKPMEADPLDDGERDGEELPEEPEADDGVVDYSDYDSHPGYHTARDWNYHFEKEELLARRKLSVKLLGLSLLVLGASTLPTQVLKLVMLRGGGEEGGGWINSEWASLLLHVGTVIIPWIFQGLSQKRNNR